MINTNSTPTYLVGVEPGAVDDMLGFKLQREKHTHIRRGPPLDDTACLPMRQGVHDAISIPHHKGLIAGVAWLSRRSRQGHACA